MIYILNFTFYLSKFICISNCRFGKKRVMLYLVIVGCSASMLKVVIRAAVGGSKSIQYYIL